MLLDFISTVSVAFGAAGVYLIANRLTGRRLPRWGMPAAIAAAMLSFTIWNEYTWFGRVKAQLPAEVVIVRPVEDRVLYRPWTYVKPMVTRFLAVDRTTTTQSTTIPGLRVASVVAVQRWTATQRVPMAFDCVNNRRADLFEGAELGEGGTISGADWQDVAPDDPVQRAACDGG